MITALPFLSFRSRAGKRDSLLSRLPWRVATLIALTALATVAPGWWPAWLSGGVLALVHPGRRLAMLSAPYGWLLLFFLTPFLIVVKISFSEADIAMPPYTPIVQWAESAFLIIRLNFGNFLLLVNDSLYGLSYLNSIWTAAIATACTLVIGYPMALGIVRSRHRALLLTLLIIPFWTSFLIRVYAWIGILKQEGLLNQLLIGLGFISQPLIILNTPSAVRIGIVYSYLPFMVLPLYATMARLDDSLIEAAGDLGCPPLKAFWSVTFPLSLPGVVAGCLLVFTPAIGEFVIPDLLGGSETLMIGKTLWNEFFSNHDWPVAAAVAVVLLLLLIPPILFLQRIYERNAFEKPFL